jgi:DNA-directed RNA polymerase specialized sigma24 family protein
VLEPTESHADEPTSAPSGRHLQSEPELDFAAIYEWALPLMIGTAVARFGVPESDAETLAHEIYLDFLVKGPAIDDRRGWFVGAVFNASRAYRRKSARHEELPANYTERPDPHLVRVLDMWPDQLAGREAFERTTAKCQLALRLRYFEGYTIPEIAAELGITKTYASKLVSESLRQAHRRYIKPQRGTNGPKAGRS